MPLKHAILGFLNLKPMSGYEMKYIFDNSVSHFWSAKQSQIYRELNNLLEAGFVEVKKVEQEKRPDKKVFHIRQSGKEELQRWLTTPLEAQSHRIPFLIQVFFAGAVSQEDALKILEKQEEQNRRVLELFQGRTMEFIEEFTKNLPNGKNSEFFRLTLELGIRHQETLLNWLEYAKKKIEMINKRK